jgi:leucyl aminopeptidase
VIISNINKMVNQFNENNKLIKEQNKNQKNEKETAELILKNKEIQNDCFKIEEKIGLAKQFANQINERLDNILNPTTLEIKDKYLKKNLLIDECDENFDKVNAAIK